MTLIKSISGIRGTIGGAPGASLTPHSIERLYDIRLVRTSQAAGNENILKLASDRSDPLLLGSRIPRILRSGAGQ